MSNYSDLHLIIVRVICLYQWRGLVFPSVCLSYNPAGHSSYWVSLNCTIHLRDELIYVQIISPYIIDSSLYFIVVFTLREETHVVYLSKWTRLCLCHLKYIKRETVSCRAVGIPLMQVVRVIWILNQLQYSTKG